MFSSRNYVTRRGFRLFSTPRKPVPASLGCSIINSDPEFAIFTSIDAFAFTVLSHPFSLLSSSFQFSLPLPRFPPQRIVNRKFRLFSERAVYAASASRYRLYRSRARFNVADFSNDNSVSTGITRPSVDGRMAMWLIRLRRSPGLSGCKSNYARQPCSSVRCALD